VPPPASAKTHHRGRRYPVVRTGGKAERARGSRSSIPRPRCHWCCCRRHRRSPRRSSADRRDRSARRPPWWRIRRRRCGRYPVCSRHRRWAPSSANGAALALPPTPTRPSMKGSVSNPRNWLIASKVACCDPVAVSPEACVKPPGVNEANAKAMPPLALKKLGERSADVLLIDVEVRLRAEVEREIDVGVVRVIAQGSHETARSAAGGDAIEGAANTTCSGQDAVIASSRCCRVPTMRRPCR